MRRYYQIDLTERSTKFEELTGTALVESGRLLIARTLVKSGTATVDPLGPANPLIISAGPFAGTTFSNANRISVGCKSPLTGGIKEANAGGTLGYAMGRLEIAGMTLHGQSEDWVVLHFKKDGDIVFEDASPYMGKGNVEASELLFDNYGKKIAYALCGPVGEYQGLLAGITISDSDGRPSRLAARGGVGAVMGSKKIKAIVMDVHTMPKLHDRKKTLSAIRDYAKKINEEPIVRDSYKPIGTMAMADYTNHIGGIPVNNFTLGAQMDNEVDGEFRMGGDYITRQNNERGGQHSHACMPGCAIQCSNVYVDADGNEITSPVEYETLAMLGTNCGLTDPDDLAHMNQRCNDLGTDTIETGATIAVLMDSGMAEFGDIAFMERVFAALGEGTEEGQLWAQGSARVAEYYNFHRAPVVKKQAVGAYDPRVIEVTGISMMTTAQGGDHTVGNVPNYKSRDKDVETLMKLSLEAQIASAATDSIGFCIFGRFVTNPNIEALADAINSALGTDIQPGFFYAMGREVLLLERQFNLDAGFDEDDDDLAEFFYDEALPPTDQAARFRGKDVFRILEMMDEVGAQFIPDEYGHRKKLNLRRTSEPKN
ncbi:MAG: aldehyde ferredoxin oxidoreductase [Chloroflexi bacterium]|nr:MAG: aldehyde ferredoxin oxidoreductase [Chloroflexota bacterium]MBL1192771.1 aldehyde ferredoxin oxidoreductase [Chloroflexota bacterium]NOH10065.1 aldehyde ferredoxin oxidoreductase [Chloroflexota bacterium]